MRNRFFLATPLLLLMLLSSCWRKCKDPLQCNFPEEFLKYTKVYKPGNWWAYTNLNGTKRDTFYVENFKEQRTVSNLCWEGTQITFSLKGKSKSFPCRIGMDGLVSANSGEDRCLFDFSFNHITMIMHRDTIFKWWDIEKDTYSLNNKVYQRVLFKDGYRAIAPDVGIVLHINNVDTLLLYDYFIK